MYELALHDCNKGSRSLLLIKHVFTQENRTLEEILMNSSHESHFSKSIRPENQIKTKVDGQEGQNLICRHMSDLANKSTNCWISHIFVKFLNFNQVNEPVITELCHCNYVSISLLQLSTYVGSFLHRHPINF